MEQTPPPPPPQQQHHSSNQRNDVLLNMFYIKKKKYRVLLHFDALIWEKENSKSAKKTVFVVDILAVNISQHKNYRQNQQQHQQQLPNNIIGDGRNVTQSANNNSHSATTQTATDNQFINVHYATRNENSPTEYNIWRKNTVTLFNSDYRIIKLWYDTFTSILHDQKRPKNILMFINPFGGRKQALQIYEKYSKPLFQIAGIDVSCVVSQRPNQIRDIILTQSLDHYDAICCIGGDGTFSEVFNGLIYRAINDLKLDPVRPEYIPKPKIPIGVIPGGSTDTVAFCLHGTTDIRTAVIHIILGQTRGLDISSVCNSNGLMKLYASVMSYGYLGDVALDSERYRWMGPKRYDYSGFKKIVSNRGYYGEIMLLNNNYNNDIDSNDHEEEKIKCYVNCKQCETDDVINMENLKSTDAVINEKIKHKIDYAILTPSYNKNNTITQSNNTDILQNKWKNVKGKFFMISGANISCACKRSPNGFSPYCHLGDGYIDIVVVRHTTLLNNIRLLLTLVKTDSYIGNLPFVEIYRAQKFYFRTPKSHSDGSSLSGSCQPIGLSESITSSQWNCDGEIIHDSDVLISSHSQLINVFMRGPYAVSEKLNASCCRFCKT